MFLAGGQGALLQGLGKRFLGASLGKAASCILFCVSRFNAHILSCLSYTAEKAETKATPRIPWSPRFDGDDGQPGGRTELGPSILAIQNRNI